MKSRGKGYGLVEAVCFLINENPQERSEKGRTSKPSSPNTERANKTGVNTLSPLSQKPAPIGSTPPIFEKEPPQPRQPISLPIRNKDNNRVIAYLQSRGIDRDLILDCINCGILYESRNYHNAVFLGKDEHGKTHFAAMRSTNTRFMRDADGSDKNYGFVLLPNNPVGGAGVVVSPFLVTAVAIYESPIDCLSHQTLCEQGYIPPFDGWRLSLGGTSLGALEQFLLRHPQITHCLVCTDNDEAGDKVAVKIADMLMGASANVEAGANVGIAKRNITFERSPPIHGKDWNDTLQAMKKAERTVAN